MPQVFAHRSAGTEGELRKDKTPWRNVIGGFPDLKSSQAGGNT